MTVVGLLLFGRRLAQLLAELKIDAIWFKGTERAADRWWDQRSISGTLAEQYDSALGFLRRWTSRVQGSGSRP